MAKSPVLHTEIEVAAKERQYLVVQHNNLIQRSRYDLSAVEQKIVLRLIQMIRPEDESFKLYEFSIRDFCRLCGINPNSGRSYNQVKDCIKRLADKSIYITLPGTTTQTLIRWIDKPYINEGSGTVSIRMDPDMKPFLIQLHEQFTAFSLYYTLPMKSKYSIRLYQLLKSYGGTDTPIVFSVHRLKVQLEIEPPDDPQPGDKGKKYPNYSKWSDFKTYVLDAATNEINRYTDLHIVWVGRKKGRKIEAIEFLASPASPQTKEEHLRLIDEKLNPQEIRNGFKKAAEPETEERKIQVEQLAMEAVAFGRTSTIPYSCGAHKPVMETALRNRMDIEALRAKLSESQQDSLELAVKTAAGLCCRHTQTDVLVDGGNKAYIEIINDIIIKYGRLDDWFEVEARKYDNETFWSTVKSARITNEEGYVKHCMEHDLNVWKMVMAKAMAQPSDKGKNTRVNRASEVSDTSLLRGSENGQIRIKRKQ